MRPEGSLAGPVIIRYYDHVEFRNMNFSKLEPMLREVVGWVVHEDSEKIVLLIDKPITDDLEEISKLRPSGFIIMKNCIREIIPLDIHNELPVV